MKSQFSSALRRKGAHYAPKTKFNTFASDLTILLGTALILAGFLFSGCQKGHNDSFESQLKTNDHQSEHAGGNVVDDYTGLSSQTLWELQQARAHTAKYRDIRNAIKDGYADISVVVPNMGHHYMKLALSDANFDFRKPEILVYNKEENGDFTLVAVEYAVPIDVTPNVAPAGFTGSADVWDRNTVFGLWLLHAWVWSYNPDGVFNPTNPSVHVH